MHLIKFKGRNRSDSDNLNLLYNIDNIYLMDNHLAASWCWLQKIDISKRYNLFHIDRHYDLQISQIDCWIKEFKNNVDCLSKISINQLLELNFKPKNSPQDYKYKIFQFDNYLTIFNRLYPNLLENMFFATHKDGETIDDFNISEIEIYELSKNLSFWINSNSNNKWIVNIDIDYFFSDINESYFQLLTNDYIKTIAKGLITAKENIEVITIALSPEYCGGWGNAEKVAKLLMGSMNIAWFE